MAKRVWTWKKTKETARSTKPSDVEKACLDVAIDPMLVRLRKRMLARRKPIKYNAPEELFARWYRSALYIVVIRRTPHGLPPTFESHAARIQFTGEGQFEFAVPLRKGWSKVATGMTAEEIANLLPQTVLI
jgi:hypothetical protein